MTEIDPATPPRNLSRWLLAIGFALAGTLQPARADSLLDVYDAARDNDPVLGAAGAAYEARQEALPQARAGLLPNISASGSTSWNERSFPGRLTDPATGERVKAPDQEFNDHGWRAEFRQPVINVENWYSYQGARASVEQARWSYASTEQLLLVRVVDAYLAVLRAQDFLESAQAEEEAVKRQLEQVQQRFEVGLVAITDVLESQAIYDNAVVRRIQAASDQDVFFESLRTLTGRGYEELDRLSEAMPIVDPEPISEEAWVATALESNFGIRAAHAQLEASERTLRARRAGHLPTVDAVVSQTHSVTGGTAFLGNKIDVTTYALSLNVPIYQGGLTSARAREARALAEQARQLLLEQQLTVTRDTRSLFRTVATDVVRVEARRRSIESAESALEATQTGYEVGTRNIVDVLQAQQRLYLTQFDYADSRYRYVLDLILLRQAAGTLAEDDLIELNRYGDAQDPVRRVQSVRVRSIDRSTH
jgi:outer membrane protein